MSQPTTEKSTPRIGLAMQPGTGFGWGHCARELIDHGAETGLLESVNLEEAGPAFDGTLVHQCRTAALDPAFEMRGTRNVGYTFFEAPLQPEARIHGPRYDLLLGGSTWCRDRLRDAGFARVRTLIQGIDPTRFRPTAARPDARVFVIYSGGKFEFRKGQDVVIAACRELFPRYPDMILVANWGNHWRRTMETMQASSHVTFEPDDTLSTERLIEETVRRAGVPMDQVVFAHQIPHHELPELMARTHVGLFPNRCEGGTNLVLMEYMAMGRAAIATHATGQADVLADAWSLPLELSRPLRIASQTEMPDLVWAEPSLDEVIESIERAYHERERLELIGRAAAREMHESFTWRHSARELARLAARA